MLSSLRRADICIAALSACLVIQSLFLLHVLSEAQPEAEAARPRGRALGGSVRSLLKLQKWYCAQTSSGNASALSGPDAASAVALKPASLEQQQQQQQQPACRPCSVFMSCKPFPSPLKTCPTCAATAAKCSNAPALPAPMKELDADGVAKHDHKKASEADELDEFGELLRRRFTDVACHLYPDETELCVYHNAICFDGSHVVLSVPHPPGPSKLDPNGMGYVLGDPTGGCYDYRYYEPSAIEYSACKFDLFKFNRVSRYTQYPAPSVTSTPRTKGAANAAATPSQMAPRKAIAANNSGFGDLEGIPLRRPNLDWALPLHHRRWGPFNRGAVKFREVAETALYGPRPTGISVLPDGAFLLNDRKTALAEWKHMRAQPAPPKYPAAHFNPGGDVALKKLKELGLGIASVTMPADSNYTVYWLDGNLWAMAMDAQFDRHIYHATTRLMALYHAQRANRTRWGNSDGDGFLPPLTEVPLNRGVEGLPPVLPNHPIEERFPRLHRLALSPAEADEVDAEVLSRWKAAHGGAATTAGSRIIRPNRVSYTSSPGWDIPSQDYVVLTGNNQSPPAAMIPFLRNIAALIAQPHTTFVAGPSLSFLNPNKTLLCAKRGAVTGTHPRLFMNRADAWMFRKYAYDYAGAPALGLHPHMHHPPRKITVLTRKASTGRNFENGEELIRVIRDSGIPYEVINDMGELTFKQQVVKMAGTGILIAAHGAALVNSMFLPQHAVVMELFPYMLKKLTYFNLAGLLGLWYLPVFSGLPTLTGKAAEAHFGVQQVHKKASNGQDFLEGCVAANMSSVDALLHHRCNSVSKHLPVKVDIPAFSSALKEAIDIIAGFSAHREEWAQELAQLKGSPAPSASRKPAPANQQQQQQLRAAKSKAPDNSEEKPAASKPASAAAKTKPAASASAAAAAAKKSNSRSPTAAATGTPASAVPAEEDVPLEGAEPQLQAPEELGGGFDAAAKDAGSDSDGALGGDGGLSAVGEEA